MKAENEIQMRRRRGMVKERYLFPVFALLVVLPFFVIPLLNAWKNSMPTYIQKGEYYLPVVPMETKMAWLLADINSALLILGAIVGFLGIFYLIGKKLEK